MICRGGEVARNGFLCSPYLEEFGETLSQNEDLQLKDTNDVSINTVYE